MSNEIATYSMILSKLSLGKSGAECPTKTQILAINSLIIIDNASTYGANECVKIDDIRKKVETWNYYLTVSPTSMSFGAGGGSKSFTVSSYKRKVLDGVEQSGDTSVSLKSTTISGTGFSLSGTTVSASANEITSNRTGTVTITQNESNKTATISLSQDGDDVSSYGEWTISVSASPTSVSSSGGTSTITASAKRTVYWASGDVTEETGNPTLSTNLGSLSSTSSPSTLTLGENTSTSSRTATIKATHGGKSATCTVTQTGATPSTTYTFSVNPYKVYVDSSGGPGSVTITSYKTVDSITYDVDYSIDSSTLPSWASFNKSTSTFTIQSTTDTIGRTTKVYFDQDESGKRDYAEITQTGYTPPEDEYTFEIRKSDEEYTGKTSITFDVPASTVGWSGNYAYRSRKNGEQFANVSFSSNASWLHVESSGAYTVYHNTGSLSRSGTITLTQAESGLKCYIYINQSGYTPTYTFNVTPTKLSVTAAETNETLTVNSYKTVLESDGSETTESLDYEFSSNNSWVAAARTTTNTTYITVAENETTTQRTAKITLTQAESGAQAFVNVIQAGATPDDYLSIINSNISTTAVYAVVNFKSSQPWTCGLTDYDADNPVIVGNTTGDASDIAQVLITYQKGYRRPRRVNYNIRQTAGQKLTASGSITFN